MRAELHFVCSVGLRSATFVLHGYHSHRIRGRLRGVELNDVCPPNKPQAERADCKPADDTESASRLYRAAIHALMQMSSFDGQAILHPHLLDVDERTLTRAEDEVLEGGKGEQIFFRKHDYTIHCSTTTPFGRSPSARVIE